MKNIKKLLLIFVSVIFIQSCTTNTENPYEIDGIDRSANFKGTGSSGQDILSDMNFTSLYIEIVYETGARPDDSALSIFRNFLESRIYKPDGIEINLRLVEASNRSPFDGEDIKAVERESRTAFNAGDELAIWIYFANGKKEGDPNDRVTLGSAFRNTSIIIYGETIREFSNRNGAPNRALIEAATLNHEMGHLFGLVNLGIEPVSEHEEVVVIDGEEKGNHCSTEGCLMGTELEFRSGLNDLLDDTGVPELGQACIDDLQSVGGK